MQFEGISETESVTHPFGTWLPLTSGTGILFGRKLDLEQREADVANMLLHKADDTLYLVDSGATPEFRERLRGAIESMRPFRHLVLVNTHGHVDHIANNSIIDEIECESRAHYASLGEIGLMRDNASYLRTALEFVGPWVDLPGNAADVAHDLMSLFTPVEARIDEVHPIESLPMHAVELGGTLWEGWKLGTDLLALRLHGHTPGHLAFFIPSDRTLYLGDATNACYPAWPDSLPWASFDGLRKAQRMLKSGAVETVLDGHHHVVFDGERGRRLLQTLVNDYQFLDHVVIDALRKQPGGLTLDDLSRLLHECGLADGVYENPVLARMQIARKLQGIGASALSGSGPDTRFGFNAPAAGNK